MIEVERGADDAYLEEMKAARHGGAVLKLRLITLRSEAPDVAVLALEGDDDKVVYSQWIRRIRPALPYEMFPCYGKKGVRELKRTVARDLGGLERNLFYLVDRDFDDLRGFSDDVNVYMTPSYSVENFIVSDDVVAELLRSEFPCHARPELRSQILKLFEQDYESFLAVTRELNWRVYLARRIPLPLPKRLPASVNAIARIELGAVAPCAVTPPDAVPFGREPTNDEISVLEIEFAALEPRSRYRGKFAYKFFRDWISRLADEHAKPVLNVFQGLDGESHVKRAELALSNFASKSRIPPGLPEFIDALPA